MKSLAILCLFLMGCGANLSTKIPSWDGKIYVGSSRDQAIVRKQSNEIISCADEQINQHLCMSAKDFTSFYNTYVLGCRSWKTQPNSNVRLEAKKNFDAAREIMNASR